MSTRSARDKQKEAQERHQVTLSGLLKDEDNKYCVDCDAKGPRWASWNLGIFLCIRCAGIHRNLGVHISKVKSVNLDSWTAEQIAMMQEMGNSRARAVYEANLPDNFRRPQTDSGLEAFIRAKYETKKYIAKEWIPPQPKVQPASDPASPFGQERPKKKPVIEETKKEKKRPRPKATAGVQLQVTPPSKSSVPTETPEASKPTEAASPPKPQSASIDLLGLDTPAPHTSHSAPDLFSSFIGSSTDAAPLNPTTSDQVPTGTAPSAEASTAQASNPSAKDDLNLFGENGPKEDGKTQTTKESILALYGSGGNQQMFGVPGGMYMPQQMMGTPQQPVQNGGMMGMMPPSSVMAPSMQVPQKPGMMPSVAQDPAKSAASADSTNLMVLDPVIDLQSSVKQGVGAPYNVNASMTGPRAVAGPSLTNPSNPAFMHQSASNPFASGMGGMYSQAGGALGVDGGGGIMSPSGVYGQTNGYKDSMYQQPQQQHVSAYDMEAMMYNMMSQQQAAGGMMMGGLHHSMSQPNMMMPPNNMYNPAATPNMYNSPVPQQQQQQQSQQPMHQLQNQMAGMNLAGYQQPAGAVANGGWGNQPSGQTLSNNLWQ